MKLRTEEPHVAAYCRDGTSWILPVEAWDDFRAAWMAGKAFWEGRAIWGEPVAVKLGDITGMVVKASGAIERDAAEREEERHRKLLQGGGD